MRMGRSPEGGHRKYVGLSAKCSSISVIIAAGRVQVPTWPASCGWKAAGVSEPQAGSFVRSSQSQEGRGPGRQRWPRSGLPWQDELLEEAAQ